MAKARKAEFPATVYLAREYSGNQEYLVVKDAIEDHADLDGGTRVAIYKLEKIVTVKVNVETEAD